METPFAANRTFFIVDVNRTSAQKVYFFRIFRVIRGKTAGNIPAQTVWARSTSPGLSRWDNQLSAWLQQAITIERKNSVAPLAGGSGLQRPTERPYSRWRN